MTAPSRDMSARQVRLTRAQRQLVELATRGDTAEEIGRKLGISKSSAAHGLNRARAAIGARNAAHLGAMAVALGIVDPASLWGWE